MKTKFCPDCVVVLEPHRRKLGVISRWLKCPKCGLVDTVYQPKEDPMRSQKIIENNINQIDRYYEN